MRTEVAPLASADSLRRDFQSVTGLLPETTPEYERQLRPLVEFLASRQLLPFEERKGIFLARANRKFRLSAEALQRFYGMGARHGVTFNYHQKTQIQFAFDSGRIVLLNAVLASKAVQEPARGLLLEHFETVSESATIQHIKNECREPTKLREYSKLRKAKGSDGVSREIVQAQFSTFLFGSLPVREMHSFFDPAGARGYAEDFWTCLQRRAPDLFNRREALHVVYVKPEKVDGSAYEGARALVERAVRASYEALNNYGCLCVVIPPLPMRGRDRQAELVADLTLFAEKHAEVRLDKGYFQPRKIRETTEAHIGAPLDGADFEVANEGFTYRDCFVIAPSRESAVGEATALVVFQKNQRDETLIPCPACRSSDVQGNSYPILGVKSWECNNLLCPERSKYNRGKRYSFRGLLMQRAIDDDANEIPKDFVRSWQRDVQDARPLEDLLEMVVRHYSLAGDAVHVFDWPDEPAKKIHGRVVKSYEDVASAAEPDLFWKSAIFRRYAAASARTEGSVKRMGDEELTVLCGDSSVALRAFGEGVFDGAVTSPPYFNAREYSQWPNVYCYLHDMLAVNAEVFRTLKPGACYLYNIFDYFDNENTTALSAMGQKRMILSAYTVDLFRRIGFECAGNIAWDKGDIEGKRGFNAGNFSPYYQAPFNCWEHILVFRKPGKGRVPRFPAVLRERAVIKMVKGENTHGHSAPFPDAIPDLLVSRLQPGAVVLDPFAGSLTTGRVANRRGLRSVCVERHEEFCRLGLEMKASEKTATKQGALF